LAFLCDFFGALASAAARLGFGCGAPDTLPQRLHQVDDVSTARTLLRGDRLAGALLIDELDQSRFVVILEYLGIERAGLLVDDVLCEVEHMLGDFNVLDLVRILLLRSHFVRVAQQRADPTLVEWLKRDDVLSVGQHHPSDGDLVHIADGLLDHGEGIVPRPCDPALGSRGGSGSAGRCRPCHEFVDLDRPGQLQRELLELLFGDVDELVLLEPVALHDILVGHLVAGVGDLQISDAVTGRPVELVERDLLALRGRRIERDGTGDERQSQEAFPVGSRGHDFHTPDTRPGFKTIMWARFRHSIRSSDDALRGRPALDWT